MNPRVTGLVTTLLLMLAACDQTSPGSNSGSVPAGAVQRPSIPRGVKETAAVVEPTRYVRLSDLALALRKAGHACEAVRTYKELQQNKRASAVYKVDCLEYSYKLTIINGRTRIERWAAPAVRE